MKAVFEALPHVNEIWVTDDGHFHLHSQNGGKLVTRDTAILAKSNESVEEKKEEVKQVAPKGQPKQIKK